MLDAEPRTFLGYAFVWCDFGICGYLTPLHSTQLPVTRGATSKLSALVRLLGGATRAAFEARVLEHLPHLHAWRAAVRPLRPSDTQTICLLEVAKPIPGERRPRYDNFTVAAAGRFDFRVEGSVEPLGRIASNSSGGRISCAAMMVLLDLQDELVNQADRGADARLAKAILALYDIRPGAAMHRPPLRQRVWVAA